MTFSIVIATFNASATLGEALQSCISQTYPEVQIIIADGSSSDNTVAIAKSYANLGKRIDVFSEPDRGIYDAWNKALPHCTGEWILFLGADDKFAHPTVLADLFSHIKLATNTNFVTSVGGVLDATRTRVVRRIGIPLDNRIFNYMTLCHPGLLHHRSMFLQTKFDIDLKICADYDLILRCLPDIRPTHFNQQTVLVGGFGISRKQIRSTLGETLKVQMKSGRIAPHVAYKNLAVAHIKGFIRRFVLR